MGYPSISLVLPTIGREGLEASLDAIVAAGISRHDELLCMVDGEHQLQTVDRICAHPIYKVAMVRTFLMMDSGGAWGHPGRNRGMGEVRRGDVVMFTQDDQLLVPGALRVVRSVLRADPEWKRKGHMFQVVPRNGGMMPVRDGETNLGHIDADCVCLPMDLSRYFSRWASDYNGDNAFICQTKAAMEVAGYGFAYHMALISVNEAKLDSYPEMFRVAEGAVA